MTVKQLIDNLKYLPENAEVTLKDWTGYTIPIKKFYCEFEDKDKPKVTIGD